eukprot:364523-Chlamydomonas_euryale.AAC.1
MRGGVAIALQTRRGMLQRGAVWRVVFRCNMVRCGALCFAATWCGVARCVLLQHGAVWCVVFCCDMVQCGALCFAATWCSVAAQHPFEPRSAVTDCGWLCWHAVVRCAPPRRIGMQRAQPIRLLACMSTR